MTAPTATTSTDVTVVCHVRAPLLLEPVDRQIETLQACDSEGTIDDLLLRSWPKEIALTDNSPYQEALDSFERFEAWAADQGVSIRPPFQERTKTSQVTGETTDLLVTPLLCLELYADDELVGVFPHTDEGTEETYTTDEAIASLRTGELPTPLAGSRESEATEPTATEASTNDCPDCGESLIDGQGLFACADCGWTGTVSETGQYVSQSTDARSTEREVTPENGE
ncbi:HTH domain-containing protein [Natronorubrum sp. FCH18a]|uniref:HTH domain-containing protein n=1 Tax=Natronorubrum sp. FCH18a TaxID=3447018 RepID=UPI003F510F17